MSPFQAYCQESVDEAWAETLTWVKEQTLPESTFFVSTDPTSFSEGTGRNAYLFESSNEFQGRNPKIEQRGDQNSRNHPTFSVMRNPGPKGFERCFGNSYFGVYVFQPEACPGTWKLPRHDIRNTAFSGGKGRLLKKPVVLAKKFIGGGAAATGPQVWIEDSTPLTSIIISISSGTATARKSDGGILWETPNWILSEVIAVSDLDSDGRREVILSSVSWANTFPGCLYIVDLETGELLYQYQFQDLEGGIGRDRTTIKSLDGGKSLSIVAVQKYSFQVWVWDFSRGVKNGFLKWKNLPLVYDGSDVAPLVFDVDGDGIPEVIVDSMSHLYTINSSNGKIISDYRYAEGHSLRGFLDAVDLGSDGGQNVVRVAATIYMKSITVFSQQNHALTKRWEYFLESGIENQHYLLEPFNHIVKFSKEGRPKIVASVGTLFDKITKFRLMIWDLATGHVDAEISSLHLKNIVKDSSDRSWIIAEHDNRISISTLGKNEIFQTVADFKEENSYIEEQESKLPSEPMQNRDSLHFFQRNEKTGNSLLSLSLRPERFLKNSWTFPLIKNIRPRQVFSRMNSSTLAVSLTDGANLLLDSNGKKLGEYIGTRLFHSVPLITRLEPEGKLKIIVNDSIGSIRTFEFESNNLKQMWIRKNTRSPLVEGFFSPAVADLGINGKLSIIAMQNSASGPGLITLDPEGNSQWSFPLPSGIWESMFTVGHFNSKDHLDVFYKDSRYIYNLDGRDGHTIWNGEAPGQCQREPSVFDITGDGTDDIIISPATNAKAIKGESGIPIWQQNENPSYGAHTAIAFEKHSGKKKYYVVSVGAGVFSTIDIDSGEIIQSQQLQPYKTESKQVVIVDAFGTGSQQIAQIGGDGILRLFNLDGTLIYKKDYGVRAISMTGTDIDGDGTPDFLFSTRNGKIYAVRAADGSELWTYQLPGVPGTPILADVNANGDLEIIVTSSDGYLYVLGADPNDKNILNRDRNRTSKVRMESSNFENPFWKS